MRLAFAGVKAGPARDPDPSHSATIASAQRMARAGPSKDAARLSPRAASRSPRNRATWLRTTSARPRARRRVPASGDGARRIDEHHGGHDAVGLGLGPGSRHQLLDLGHDRLGVTDPGQVIRAGQLDVARPGMCSAMYRECETSTAMSPARWTITTGTRIAGSSGRTSTSSIIRSSARAAVGVAAKRCASPPCTPRRLVAGHRRRHRREVTAVTPLALEPIERIVHRVAAPVAPDEAASPVIAGEAAPQQQPQRALGVGGREQQAHRAALRRPRSAARSDPTASITARTSSIRCSSVGRRSSGTRSDRPVPRLSNRISRQNDANRR